MGDPYPTKFLKIEQYPQWQSQDELDTSVRTLKAECSKNRELQLKDREASRAPLYMEHREYRVRIYLCSAPTLPNLLEPVICMGPYRFLCLVVELTINIRDFVSQFSGTPTMPPSYANTT